MVYALTGWCCAAEDAYVMADMLPPSESESESEPEAGSEAGSEADSVPEAGSSGRRAEAEDRWPAARDPTQSRPLLSSSDA